MTQKKKLLHYQWSVKSRWRSRATAGFFRRRRRLRLRLRAFALLAKIANRAIRKRTTCGEPFTVAGQLNTGFRFHQHVCRVPYPKNERFDESERSKEPGTIRLFHERNRSTKNAQQHICICGPNNTNLHFVSYRFVHSTVYGTWTECK